MTMSCVTIVLQSVSPVATVKSEGIHLWDQTPRTGIRLIHTSTVCRDIDQAAKYIGAGAATVGVAGSGIITYIVRVIPTKFVWQVVVLSLLVHGQVEGYT